MIKQVLAYRDASAGDGLLVVPRDSASIFWLISMNESAFPIRHC